MGPPQLFVSVNGAPLEPLHRVPASAGAFQFTAPADGLYAFAVRMTDASGQPTGDETPLAPELEVIVDTSPPELYLQLKEAAAGTVDVAWSSSDSEISPGSVQLEYAEGIDGRWKPIDATPSASGHSTIQCQVGTSVSVRGYVTDLAGNRGSGTSQIVLKTVPNTPPAGSAAAPQMATNTTANPTPPGPANGLSIPSTGGVAGANQAASLGSSPFPASQPQMPVSDYGAAVSQPPVQQYPVYSPPNGMNGSPGSNGSPSMNVGPPSSAGYPQAQPLPAGNNYVNQPPSPPSANVVMPSQPASAVGFSQTDSAPQVVNNRVFDIPYEVQGVGPSGVGSVELYVTENNGQQWFRYGNDDDRRSPFQVDSRGEGTFGFAVRVRNGLGFGDAPPQPGEAPSIVVQVDQTPPMASLLQPQVLSDDRGRVRLQWQVRDASPAASPVRLEYSTSASGPWTPLFDWQPDQGGYEMPIQPGMPTTLFYRLLARDNAGNIATAHTPQPVLIDQSRPTARLLRVQPASAVKRY